MFSRIYCYWLIPALRSYLSSDRQFLTDSGWPSTGQSWTRLHGLIPVVGLEPVWSITQSTNHLVLSNLSAERFRPVFFVGSFQITFFGNFAKSRQCPYDRSRVPSSNDDQHLTPGEPALKSDHCLFGFRNCSSWDLYLGHECLEVSNFWRFHFWGYRNFWSIFCCPVFCRPVYFYLLKIAVVKLTFVCSNRCFVYLLTNQYFVLKKVI